MNIVLIHWHGQYKQRLATICLISMLISINWIFQFHECIYRSLNFIAKRKGGGEENLVYIKSLKIFQIYNILLNTDLADGKFWNDSSIRKCNQVLLEGGGGKGNSSYLQDESQFLYLRSFPLPLPSPQPSQFHSDGGN